MTSSLLSLSPCVPLPPCFKGMVLSHRHIKHNGPKIAQVFAVAEVNEQADTEGGRPDTWFISQKRREYGFHIVFSHF